MKKIICLIFFTLLIFPIYSQENYESSQLGFYVSPFVGYSLGPQKGVSTGFDLAYKFSNGICLGAAPSYNLRQNGHEPRVAGFMAYDMEVNRRMLINLEICGGAAFPQTNPIYPFLGYRLALGVNLWKDVIAIYFGYDSKILFNSSHSENFGSEHGAVLSMRFLINKNAVIKK